ncbi:unnamed protein product [Paramecium pentaurelia]|uniref:Transmembrane protein n=1 Tax=Paramecium pentaurelia TaxID=43138 RepID=A0A8S1U5V5_9CILI|nr:unnamed protein product [Paramecium pentaurelia]
MITNFIILVYLGSWTLFIILIILIGYLLDKQYKLASISPQINNNKNPGETTFGILPITSKIQSQTRIQQITRLDNNELEDFFNNQGDNSPNLNQDDQLYSNGERNISEQHSPIRFTVDPKQVSSPRINRTPQRSNTLRRTILRKPTIGTFEGIDTVQTTNRRSLRTPGKRLSQIQSDRSSIGDFTPRSNNQKYQQNQPRISQFSNFGRVEAIKQDPNYLIPKPENDFYKCHQFSKIFYSHKEGISRIFMILTIYFRQIICMDVSGLLINYLPNFNFWIIIGITISCCFLLKISDYYSIKCIVHHHQKLKYALIMVWISSIGIIIWLIMFLSFDNLQWFIEYLPSLLLDLIVIDPLKYFMIKYCLQEPKKIREPKSKVDVLKVMQQIK